MAQSVEQLIRNQQVAGSIPASSSKENKVYQCLWRLIYLVLFYIKEKSLKWILNGYYCILCLLDHGVNMEIEFVSQSISFYFRAFSLNR